MEDLPKETGARSTFLSIEKLHLVAILSLGASGFDF